MKMEVAFEIARVPYLRPRVQFSHSSIFFKGFLSALQRRSQLVEPGGHVRNLFGFLAAELQLRRAQSLHGSGHRCR